MNETLIQGIAINEKPYSYNKLFNDTYQITFNGNIRCTIRSNIFTKEYVDNLLEVINEAYQNGYYDCSVELLNKSN